MQDKFWGCSGATLKRKDKNLIYHTGDISTKLLLSANNMTIRPPHAVNPGKLEAIFRFRPSPSLPLRQKFLLETVIILVNMAQILTVCLVQCYVQFFWIRQHSTPWGRYHYYLYFWERWNIWPKIIKLWSGRFKAPAQLWVTQVQAFSPYSTIFPDTWTSSASSITPVIINELPLEWCPFKY